ncbi:hypothetical protein HBI56_125970 [Parastagonospora nodorum]|uniref:Uncharacterized protein n=1 Tax=Phaeosphaeria nodorum (strain SN15 / ATCC MYA-4574 / FGSC 10173) TaxID=321614 RepID=A0A7U2F525_PHANO|nr:hypothetical protein HBH56_167330 [Parastagonospora nodorum]QRC98616.1 hypothetical protein JI435_435910 [Parastagonospora nodorum SN15]KAH3936428.1 hypothetical protein HBH54_030410 [Parastagonospora nodorum]KAH3948394.1 hypothetical protein HBH53_105200 [Parastagonospora nodorum]KAH3968846.1 hypothetical protein HBH51_129100 [Parastagonospora nodorum]
MATNHSDAQLQISLRNQQQSPLLRLPAELRNQIYEHVCRGVRLRPGSGNVHYRNILDPDAVIIPVTHMLLVCRQIHNEAALYPLSFAEIQLWKREGFQQFLNTLSERQRNAIHTVHTGTLTFIDSADDMKLFWLLLPTSQYVSLEDYMPLTRLAGLQRVEVTVNHMAIYWSGTLASTDAQMLTSIKLAVKHLGARPGVKVSFKFKTPDDKVVVLSGVLD